MTWLRPFAMFLALTLGAIAPGAALAQISSAQLSLTPAGPQPVTADDLAIGDADAPITLIEYASLACPHCGEWHREIYPAIRREWIDTGRVRFVYRHIPTNPATVSLPGASLVICTPQDQRGAVLDVLMHNQDMAIRQGRSDEWLMLGAQASSLSIDAAATCMDAPETRQTLQDQVNGARAIGVQGTPTFFVNGVRIDDRSAAGLAAAFTAAARN